MNRAMIPAILVIAILSGSCATTGGAKGNTVLAVSLPNLSGGRVDLQRYQGRVVLVEFFTTWCAPCLATMPHHNQLWRRHRKAGLVVIGVCMDRRPGGLLGPFLRMVRVDYPVLLASKALRRGETSLGRISSVPIVMLIGRKGKLRAWIKGVPKRKILERAIRALLRER